MKEFIGTRPYAGVSFDQSLNNRTKIMFFDLSEEKYHRKLSVPEVRDIVFMGLVIHRPVCSYMVAPVTAMVVTAAPRHG